MSKAIAALGLGAVMTMSSCDNPDQWDRAESIQNIRANTANANQSIILVSNNKWEFVVLGKTSDSEIVVWKLWDDGTFQLKTLRPDWSYSEQDSTSYGQDQAILRELSVYTGVEKE